MRQLCRPDSHCISVMYKAQDCYAQKCKNVSQLHAVLTVARQCTIIRDAKLPKLKDGKPKPQIVCPSTIPVKGCLPPILKVDGDIRAHISAIRLIVESCRMECRPPVNTWHTHATSICVPILPRHRVATLRTGDGRRDKLLEQRFVRTGVVTDAGRLSPHASKGRFATAAR